MLEPEQELKTWYLRPCCVNRGLCISLNKKTNNMFYKRTTVIQTTLTENYISNTIHFNQSEHNLLNYKYCMYIG